MKLGMQKNHLSEADRWLAVSFDGWNGNDSTSLILLSGWKVISDYRIFFAFWQMD